MKRRGKKKKGLREPFKGTVHISVTEPSQHWEQNEERAYFHGISNSYFSNLASMLGSVQAAQLDVRDAFKEAGK